MSHKEQVHRYRRISDWFLSMFAVNVSVLGKDNWHTLAEDTHTEGITPFLAGLTHKDYLDAPAVWNTISDPDTLLKFIVMAEGFSGGVNQVRNSVASMMGSTLPLSRHNTSKEEIKAIQEQGNENSAVVLYLTGNRNLQAPLKPGFQLLMREQDMFYPFINLSDTKPAFPSGSTFQQNVREFFDRVLIHRQQSTEFLYLMKPLSKVDLEKMKEGKRGKEARAEVMQKLEVIRAYGVLKTISEIVGVGQYALNPVYTNTDNVPLVLQSQHLLEKSKHHIDWLVAAGYLPEDAVQSVVSVSENYATEKN